jgi:hypothetical protein
MDDIRGSALGFVETLGKTAATQPMRWSRPRTCGW